MQDDFTKTFVVQNSSCNSGLCQAHVVLLKKFNYDEKNVYSLVVVAKDGANRSKRINKARLPVIINVEDAQNNPPVFVDDTKAHFIEENTPIVKNSFFNELIE